MADYMKFPDNESTDVTIHRHVKTAGKTTEDGHPWTCYTFEITHEGQAKELNCGEQLGQQLLNLSKLAGKAFTVSITKQVTLVQSKKDPSKTYPKKHYIVEPKPIEEAPF